MENKTSVSRLILERPARLRRSNLKDAEQFVTAAIEGMSKALAKGSHIEPRGFGSFQPKNYDRYACGNPKTVAPTIVAA